MTNINIGGNQKGDITAASNNSTITVTKTEIEKELNLIEKILKLIKKLFK